MTKTKYDVGIMGLWSGCNYGSIITYYALHHVIADMMGKSVLMLDKPVLSEDDVELKRTHSRRFAEEYYTISERYCLNELEAINDTCNAFVIGSDQVWNYGISKNFGKRFYFDFVHDDKKKIAYAVSFGHGVDFAPPEEREKIAKLMARFDGIGVRESDGVRLCKDVYGIKAVQVLDPVFLPDVKIYDTLAQKSIHREDEPYIVAYILDPTPEKREAILHLSQKLGGIKIINLLDGFLWKFKSNQEKMNLPNCIENLQVEDWLYYLKHAEFVLTDSCHGVSFSLIFKKKFAAITNKHRGISRFSSLSKLFHFGDRVVNDPKIILSKDSFLDEVDYHAIDGIMAEQREESYTWLKEKLDEPKKSMEEVKEKNVISSEIFNRITNEKNLDIIPEAARTELKKRGSV